MKITIVSSSQGKESESERVGRYMATELGSKLKTEDVNFINLADINLPFFDDTLEDNEELQKVWNPVAEKLKESDGFVLITPEWAGMASPMLKNFFLYVDEELAHKPALLVSVSSSLGGSYPIVELRASSYKNSHVVYIPNHVIVRNVNECLKDEVVNPESRADTSARGRIDNSLDILIAYSKALKSMRNEKIDWQKFPYGM